ncbi:MAG TPA: GNAT family N-acetyltransferase [Thermoanaerobaculia bacterium]|nr:GNAT family N-acetyltransferase [Thermoanaerobaculia bacterium]
MSRELPFLVRSARPDDAAGWAALRCALWPDEDPGELTGETERYFAGDRTIAEEVLVVQQRDAGSGAAGSRDAGARDVGSGEVERDGRLVAMAELSIRPFVDGCRSRDVTYLEAWFVAAEHRRSGLGRRLVAAAETWARSRGCVEMASDTDPANAPSRSAHVSCGFEEVATVVQFRKDLR